MKKFILIAVAIQLIMFIFAFNMGQEYKEDKIVKRINEFPNERESYSETEMEYIIFGESQL